MTTALPLARLTHWWVRIFDFPRTQILFLGLITVFLYLFLEKTDFLEKVLFLLVLLSITYQSYKMFPYTPFKKVEVLKNEKNNPERIFSIMVANVYMKNRDFDSFYKVLKNADPDVLCVLEPDHWWKNRLKIIDPEYKYSVKRASEDTYGMLFYSKLEFEESNLNFIVEGHIPSVHASLKLESGDLLDFYCLHPNPPNPKYDEDTEERDAELLIVGKEAKNSKIPVIVAGDLNDVAWSSTTILFQKISGLLDPRKGRGFYNTFHAKIPILRFPLDHIFSSVSLRLVELKKLPYIGSDHFPIYAKFSYEPGEKEEQKAPNVSIQDKKRAEEKIEEAD